MHSLRQGWDDIILQLNEGKAQLEGASSQWEAYEESLASLTKWLSDTEAALKLEAGLQATLQEKRVQLERLKTLLLSIGGQQAPMAMLRQKADGLAELTNDAQLSHDVRQLGKRYEALSEAVKVNEKIYIDYNYAHLKLLHSSPKSVSNHNSLPWLPATDP